MRRRIPNLITMFRAFCVPWMVWLLVCETRTDGHANAIWAALVFVVAAITDWIDGWLARRWSVVSAFGKLVDPLADKLIVLSALIMAVELHWIEGWVVILVVARDIAIGTLRSLAATEGIVMPAGTSGKLKTVIQMIGLTFLLVHVPLLGLPIEAIGRWLIYISTVLAWASATEYFVAYLHPRRPSAA